MGRTEELHLPTANSRGLVKRSANTAVSRSDPGDFQDFVVGAGIARSTMTDNPEVLLRKYLQSRVYARIPKARY